MSDSIDMAVVDELLSLSGDGDPELLVDLIRMFLEDGPEKVETITRGLAAGDLEVVERAAHALKGSAGSLGAVLVQRDCETLQLSSRNGDRDRVAAAAQELVAHFQTARAELEVLLERYAQ